MTRMRDLDLATQADYFDPGIYEAAGPPYVPHVTPMPWVYDIDEAGAWVSGADGSDVTERVTDGDAMRMVAAVNATRDVPLDRLQGLNLRSVVEEARAWLDCVEPHPEDPSECLALAQFSEVLDGLLGV